MKRLLFVVAGLLVSLNLAYANDLLFKASNGALNQNSVGVKKLTDKEMAQVKGGYYFHRAPSFDTQGVYGSTAWIVSNYSIPTFNVRNPDPSNIDLTIIRDQMAPVPKINNSTIVVAKVRRLGNRKNYFLQVYDMSRKIWTTNVSYANEYSMRALSEFHNYVRYFTRY